MSSLIVPDGVGDIRPRGIGRRRGALRARLNRRRLVEQLGHGADPWSSVELMQCAAELTAAHNRETLARAIDGLLRLAEQGHAARPYVRLNSRAILVERETLNELADVLRGPDPVRVKGLALLARLLGDPSGPLFESDGAHAGHNVHERVVQCRQLLAPASPPNG